MLTWGLQVRLGTRSSVQMCVKRCGIVALYLRCVADHNRSSFKADERFESGPLHLWRTKFTTKFRTMLHVFHFINSSPCSCSARITLVVLSARLQLLIQYISPLNTTSSHFYFPLLFLPHRCLTSSHWMIRLHSFHPSFIVFFIWEWPSFAPSRMATW